MNSIAFPVRLATDVPFLHEAFLADILLRIGVGEIQAAEHPYLKDRRKSVMPQIERVGDISIVPIAGALMRRPDFYDAAYGDAEDTDAVRGLVDAAAKDDSAGIVLDMDSPGGFYGGGPELADAIRAASKTKPVVAWTGGLMASLAYWAGSQATEIVASRSATVGSIGVYIAALDVSKRYESAGVKVDLFKNKEGAFKAAGVPGTSLSETQREHFQARAQAGFEEFKAAVLAKRPGVPAEAMRGQTFTGAEAKNVGLVDRIGSRSFAIARARKLSRENA